MYFIPLFLKYFHGIKKAKRQKIDAFQLWWEKTPESPLNCKEIKQVNLKGDQLEYS